MRNAVLEIARNPRNSTTAMAYSAFSAARAKSAVSDSGSGAGVSVAAAGAGVAACVTVGVAGTRVKGAAGAGVVATGGGGGLIAPRGGRSVALTKVGIKIGVGNTYGRLVGSSVGVGFWFRGAAVDRIGKRAIKIASRVTKQNANAIRMLIYSLLR